MARMKNDTLIIDGQEINPVPLGCEVEIDSSKKQALLLDVEHYPSLLICLKDGRIEVVAEIKRDSENFKHFEHNKLIDVDNFKVEVKE